MSAPVRERVIQAQIVRLLRTVGCAVYAIGTTRRRGDYQGTMQTPGLADLEVYTPARGGYAPEQVKIEVKSATGRLSPAQVTYRAHCEAAGITYLCGGLDEVIAWLTTRGLLVGSQVAHYRRER